MREHWFSVCICAPSSPFAEILIIILGSDCLVHSLFVLLLNPFPLFAFLHAFSILRTGWMRTLALWAVLSPQFFPPAGPPHPSSQLTRVWVSARLNNLLSIRCSRSAKRNHRAGGIGLCSETFLDAAASPVVTGKTFRFLFPLMLGGQIQRYI